MFRLLGAAAVAALLLFGCAASERVAPKPTACATATAAELKQKLPEGGLKLRADLEGEPFDALVKWITPFLPKPITVERDRALVFEKEGVGLIVWMKGDCAVGHSVGPWAPLQKQLGLPV